jgi:hypothetical protein
MGSGPSSQLKGFASVQVALQKQVYTAGEIVQGYVQVDIHQTVQMTNIVAELCGAAYTTVHYTTHSGSGKNRKTHHHTARETFTFLALGAQVATFPDGFLNPGTVLFPFQFQLPMEAISSMTKMGSGRNTAQVVYTIGVKVNRPGWLTKNLCHRVVLDVVSIVPHAITPQQQNALVHVTECCCCSAGTMGIGSVTDSNAYKSGDTAVVTYHVANQSSQDVSAINIRVKELVSFKARGHRHSFESTLVDLQVAGVDKGQGFGGATDKPALQVQVPIPALRNHSLASPTLTVHVCTLQ